MRSSSVRLVASPTTTMTQGLAVSHLSWHPAALNVLSMRTDSRTSAMPIAQAGPVRARAATVRDLLNSGCSYENGLASFDSCFKMPLKCPIKRL